MVFGDLLEGVFVGCFFAVVWAVLADCVVGDFFGPFYPFDSGAVGGVVARVFWYADGDLFDDFVVWDVDGYDDVVGVAVGYDVWVSGSEADYVAAWDVFPWIFWAVGLPCVGGGVDPVFDGDGVDAVFDGVFDCFFVERVSVFEVVVVGLFSLFVVRVDGLDFEVVFGVVVDLSDFLVVFGVAEEGSGDDDFYCSADGYSALLYRVGDADRLVD